MPSGEEACEAKERASEGCGDCMSGKKTDNPNFKGRPKTFKNCEMCGTPFTTISEWPLCPDCKYRQKAAMTKFIEWSNKREAQRESEGL
jgi:hypothetical protein